MLSKAFITAGRATFTLQIAEAYARQFGVPPHYTYKVSKVKGPNTVYFVSLLTGSDNTSDYTYMGLLTEKGEVRLTIKSKFSQTSQPFMLIQRVMANVWAGTQDRIAAAGFKLHHEGRCGRCGRLLTVPHSIETGIGPECANKMAA